MENLNILQALSLIVQVQEEILLLLKERLPIEPCASISLNNDELLTRLEVQDYLRIGEATYKRKVKEGKLNPMKMPGGDRYYKRDIEAEFRESVRKGRI